MLLKTTVDDVAAAVPHLIQSNYSQLTGPYLNFDTNGHPLSE
jgi:hypothetical protein